MFHFARSSSHTYEFSVRSFDFHQMGFPHSDIPGSPVAWDLTEAYRTLQRPSSSNNVEASTVRPFAHSRKHKIVLSAFFVPYMISFLLVNCQERTNSPNVCQILSHRLRGSIRTIC